MQIKKAGELMDKSDKAKDRFIQKAEGLEITNIPPENVAFILRLREEAERKKQKPKE